MRLAWRRVAERGDKPAYTPEEIGRALAPALEQDCHEDVSSGFFSEVRRVLEQPTLFREDMPGRLEALRPEAGFGIGRAVLDNVVLLSGSAENGFGALQEALKVALIDRASRGARQVEEHYLRKSSAPRASNVRGRLEAGIGCADFEAIAARVLRIDVKPAPQTPLKLTGLDDGVTLR